MGESQVADPQEVTMKRTLIVRREAEADGEDRLATHALSLNIIVRGPSDEGQVIRADSISR